MQKAFINNAITSGISTIQAADDTKLITFLEDTSLLSEKMIRERALEISKDKFIYQFKAFAHKLACKKDYKIETKYYPATVHIIKINWLNDNLEKFYNFLSNQEMTVFDNQFVKQLVKSQNYNK